MYKYCRYCMETVDIKNHICINKPKPKIDYKIKREKMNEKTARENKFYSSQAWQTMRLSVLIKARYKCYVAEQLGEIAVANNVHHIEYIGDAWEKRLDIDNLIPISSHYHRLIHKLNINSKEKLEKLIEDLKKEKETGNYKLLNENFLDTPDKFFKI